MSAQVMQEISLDGFDDFYTNWIELTGRENTMDEYGQLAFLIKKTEAWNKCLSRYILQEKSQPPISIFFSPAPPSFKPSQK